MALFLGMARHDQRHGLRVMEHLEREGQTAADPLAAPSCTTREGRRALWLCIAYVVHSVMSRARGNAGREPLVQARRMASDSPG
jgi:hypothetical protein